MNKPHYSLSLVPVTQVDQVWSLSLGYIEKLLKRDQSLSMVNLLECSRNGTFQVWAVTDGAKIAAIAFIRFEQRGSGMAARVIGFAGSGLKLWGHLLPEFQENMKRLGASSLIFDGRKGWEKLVKARVERVAYEVIL